MFRSYSIMLISCSYWGPREETPETNKSKTQNRQVAVALHLSCPWIPAPFLLAEGPWDRVESKVSCVGNCFCQWWLCVFTMLPTTNWESYHCPRSWIEGFCNQHIFQQFLSWKKCVGCRVSGIPCIASARLSPFFWAIVRASFATRRAAFGFLRWRTTTWV